MTPRRTALALLAAIPLALGTPGVTQAQTPSAKSPATASGAGQAAGKTGMGTPGKGAGTPTAGQTKFAAPNVASGIATLPKKLQDKLNAKLTGTKKHHATSIHPATAAGTAQGTSHPPGAANQAPVHRLSGGGLNKTH
jgi:hypothetical protein